MNYQPAIFCLLISLAAITLIDTLGSIASRKLRFNYSYLAILSVAVFMGAGYFMYKQYEDLLLTLTLCGLVGFYDGSAGFWLSKRFNAQTGLSDEEQKILTSNATIPVMIGTAVLFGWVGHFFA